MSRIRRRWERFDWIDGMAVVMLMILGGQVIASAVRWMEKQQDWYRMQSAKRVSIPYLTNP